MEHPDRWKAEEERQAGELVSAIQSAIDEHGRLVQAQGRPPLLNAVAAALVEIEAAMLCAVSDARHRKELRKGMERSRPRAMARAMKRCHGTAQIFVVGGLKQ